MKLIPAIDLQRNLVAHARGGDRTQYRPVCTQRFPDATPLRVIERVLEYISTDTLYIADLDAIQKEGEQNETLLQIQKHFPSLNIWLDQGIESGHRINTTPSVTAVIGTETLRDDITSLKANNYILSLDFKAGKLLGRDIMQRHSEWPATTIAMTMDSIGTQQGPDIARLTMLRKCYSGTLIASGGVRHTGDLQVLEQIGVDGVLLASAIYSGTILSP